MIRQAMQQGLSLVLFSTNVSFLTRAVHAGIQNVIVDWENIGKDRRQAGANTEINANTFEDLIHVRASTAAHLLCRINHVDSALSSEIDAAISGGADEILLPMVRTAEQVQRALDLIAGRCRLGILIETVDAVRNAHPILQLPLSRVYVGLNDLSIERGTRNLFSAVADGTIEEIRRMCPMPFGFAGLTLPEKGYPIPCSLLIDEMARLRCEFTFLRRSFMKDIQNRDLEQEIPRIHQAFQTAMSREEEAIAEDHRKLLAAIEEADGFFSQRTQQN